MADEPESLVLNMLRGIDAKIDHAIDDVHDLKVRTSALEEGLAGVNRRLDRLDVCVERLERRLELTEAAH